MATGGRLVQIAFLSGPKAELNFAQVMVKRLTITGSTLRPQSNVAKAAIARELEAKVWPMLADGTIAPVMDSTFPLAEAANAHAKMETSQHIGKIVLVV
jgi:NADPH:quinone reductase-like Zn-dependent oxidoreductase